MDVTIREADEPDIDQEIQDLLDVLVFAFGDGLPNVISGIESSIENTYKLHLEGIDFGHAYGETLATHGWTIVGFHAHDSDGDGIDTLTVKRIEECNIERTIMYEQGDEDRIAFE